MYTLTFPAMVGSLTASAPLVLFASAVPGFGGVHHINEQPPAYWHEMFTERGYHCYDFRTEIWNDEAIEPWYRMGALVYARAGLPVAGLEKYRVAEPLHLIHPDIFQACAPIGQNLILHDDRTKRRWYPEMM
ncbi:MAG TPA: hypothetical protein VFS43_32545 [Polyangiaceae bacterium]|nr:hypothetical protein [Polyangiaceae bacterium]